MAQFNLRVSGALMTQCHLPWGRRAARTSPNTTFDIAENQRQPGDRPFFDITLLRIKI